MPGQAQSGAQLNGHGPGTPPTGPRYGSGGHSHPVRIHAYLSCSMLSSRKEASKHVLWHRSPTRCSCGVQKCEGRAREYSEEIIDPTTLILIDEADRLR